MSLPQDTGKPASDRTAPPGEQKICVECGFCCDGTLFLHAHLNPGEKGHLPEKIEMAVYSRDGRDYFRLPCGYFDRRCTIYNQKKADICHDYRCQLLRDSAGGKISAGEALQTVREAKRMRSELFEEWRRISGSGEGVHFMGILRGMDKLNDPPHNEESTAPDRDLFVVRCNIFEALLIRHFSAAGEFAKLMMPEKR